MRKLPERGSRTAKNRKRPPKKQYNAKQLVKITNAFDACIATTPAEVRAIHALQQQIKQQRIREVETILLKELEKCRRLIAQKQD